MRDSGWAPSATAPIASSGARVRRSCGPAPGPSARTACGQSRSRSARRHAAAPGSPAAPLQWQQPLGEQPPCLVPIGEQHCVGPIGLDGHPSSRWPSCALISITPRRCGDEADRCSNVLACLAHLVALPAARRSRDLRRLPEHNCASRHAMPGTAAARAGHPSRGARRDRRRTPPLPRSPRPRRSRSISRKARSYSTSMQPISSLNSMQSNKRRAAAHTGRYWPAAGRRGSGGPCPRRAAGRAAPRRRPARRRRGGSACRPRRRPARWRPGRVRGHCRRSPAGSPSLPPNAGVDLRRQMQARDGLAEGAHQLRRQPAAFGHMVEQVGLREPAHDHDMIQRRAGTIERQRAHRHRA